MKLPSTFTALVALVFPAECKSCTRPIKNASTETRFCITCLNALRPKLLISSRGSLKIFAGSKYSSQMVHIILATKEDNSIEARKILTANLSTSLQAAEIMLAKSPNINQEKIILIPIPSRKASDRKRGFSHIELLINELQRTNTGNNVEILDCLSHTKRVKDQSTLNLHERELNMGGAFTINSIHYSQIRSAIVSKTAMFLVDDLVTTGATVQAANLALLRLGARVQGVLASCATDGFTH